MYLYFEIHLTNHCALCHLLTGVKIYSFDCSTSGVVLRQHFVFVIFFFIYFIFPLLCDVLSWCVFVAYDVPLVVSQMLSVYEVQAEV
jgi:hypothetical protein